MNGSVRGQKFENCPDHLQHRLAQIAMDGSKKVPQRWLATLAENKRRGLECPSILEAIGSWLRHVRGDNGKVDDPQVTNLAAAWVAAGPTGIVDAVFGADGLLASDWSPDHSDRNAIAQALAM